MRTPEELAEAYATGNHRASFPDTFEMKAFLAGYKACEQSERVMGLVETLKFGPSFVLDEMKYETAQEYDDKAVEIFQEWKNLARKALKAWGEK